MRSTIIVLFLCSLAGSAYASDAELATSYRTYGYREGNERFPDQVQQIRIRDVVNDRESNRSRLEGMTILVAPTVVPGVSQLGN